MFGISPLGWLHTLGSLPALPLALIMLYRHGRIDPRSALGKAYGGFMVLGAVTVYPIAHAPVSRVIATLTLGVLALGFTAHHLRVLGRARPYVETVALSLSVLLLLLPTATETLRRVPDGHPLVTDLASPLLRGVHLALLAGFAIGLVIQIRALRRRAT